MDARLQRYQYEGRLVAKYNFPIPDVLCQCGIAKVTDIHHIDGNTHNNISDNIQFLCHKCHLRLERQKRNVGLHTKLTQEQIDRIKNEKESTYKLAKEFGLYQSHISKIRNGKTNPIPYNPPSVPDDWVPSQVNGKWLKPRKQALSVEQVHELIQEIFLPRRKALEYANKWNVAISTIYKAKGRYGGYAHPMFNLP